MDSVYVAYFHRVTDGRSHARRARLLRVVRRDAPPRPPLRRRSQPAALLPRRRGDNDDSMKPRKSKPTSLL